MAEVRLDAPVAEARGAGEAIPTIPGAVRYLGRGTTRALGMFTASFRPLPDFLLIGAKRGGTTSMFHHLLAHPQVLGLFPSARRLPLRAERKGVHYLDARFDAGPRWYRSNFPSQPYRSLVARRVGGPVLTGEATPYYLFHPHAAARAQRAVPRARIIVLLRNPVDRAYSHYNEQRRRGHEHLATFEEAVRAEPGRLDGEHERLVRDPSASSFAHEHQSYVTQGRYLEALDPWLHAFPMEQVHIVRSEDLYADTQSTYDRVLHFLGLSPFVLPDLAPMNGTSSPPLPVGLREHLAAELTPHNAALEDRLGRSFGWDEP
jgi:hypothetical protein